MCLKPRSVGAVLLLAVFLSFLPRLDCSPSFSGLGRIGEGTSRSKIPDSMLENGILEQIAQDEMAEEDRSASSDEPEVSSDLMDPSDDDSPKTTRVNRVRHVKPPPPIGQNPELPVVGLRRRFKEENMLHSLRSQRSRGGDSEEDAEEAELEPQELISKLERENAVLRSRLEVVSRKGVAEDESVVVHGANEAETPFIAPSEHALQMLNPDQTARLKGYLNSNVEDDGGDKRPRHAVKRSRGWSHEDEGGRLSGDSESEPPMEAWSQSPMEIQSKDFESGSFWRNLGRTVQGRPTQAARKGRDVVLVPGVTEGVGCRLSERLGYEACMLWEEGVAARMGIADAGLLAVGDLLRACSMAGGAGGLGRMLVESSRAFGSLKGTVEGVRQLDALGVGGVVIGDVEEGGWGQSGQRLMDAEQYLSALSAAVTAKEGREGGLVILARSIASSLWGGKEGMVEEVARRMQAAMEHGVDGVVIDLWGEGKGLDLEGFKAVCASLNPQPQLLAACVHAGFQGTAQGGFLQALAECGCTVLLVPELTSMRVVEAEAKALRTLRGLQNGDGGAVEILGKSISSELWGQCTGASRLAALVKELQ